jgi:hypothetical protein
MGGVISDGLSAAYLSRPGINSETNRPSPLNMDYPLYASIF